MICSLCTIKCVQRAKEQFVERLCKLNKNLAKLFSCVSMRDHSNISMCKLSKGHPFIRNASSYL